MEPLLDILKLETWYNDNHRKLPFRETQNPYYIWVSEIMAQQTQMETVIPYFERFIMKYPTIFDLANTDSDTLHKLVEGIGYYRRFQHMHDAAKLIVEVYNGVFPSTYTELQKLPGVGDYTAGAIMSIAYKKPYAATDGNVIRVFARYFGIDDDMRLPKSRKRIEHLNQTLIKDATPHIYTQALMELGALVCTKQKPACERCPLQTFCRAYHEQLTAFLPVISRQKAPKIIHYTTLILTYNGTVALSKKDEGLLKGMYLYPQYEDASIDSILTMLNERSFMVKHVTAFKNYRHVFSHAIWHMDVYQIELSFIPKDSMLVFYEDTTKIPMAIAHRKIKI